MNTAIKNLIQFIVIALTLVFPHSLYAQTFTYTYQGHSVKYTIIDREAKTCKTNEGYKNPNNTYEPGNNVSFNAIVTIPETVEYENEKYTVVEIGYASFYQNSLKKLYLPKTVKNIGELAFAGCRGMSYIGLPDSLETIQAFAFQGCNELEDAVLPYNISYIGKCAFSACGIKALVIPPKIKKIEEYSFQSCRKLEDIVFPDSLTYIGQYAFDDCRSLSSLYIPNSVYTIASYAFRGCWSLTSLTLGSSVGYIGEQNFQSMLLTKIVSLSSNPPTLYKNDCFSGVTSSTKVYVPENSLKLYSSRWTRIKNFIGFEPIDMSLDPTILTVSVGETKTVNIKPNLSDKTAFFYWVCSISSPGIISVISPEEFDNFTITGVAPGNSLIRFTVIEREHKIEYTSHCYVIVISDEDAGVDSVIVDNEVDDSAVRYYNLNGVLVNPDNLPAGIYIRKHKGETKKILVK